MRSNAAQYTRVLHLRSTPVPTRFISLWLILGAGVVVTLIISPVSFRGPSESEGARNPYAAAVVVRHRVRQTAPTGVMGSGLAAARRPGMTGIRWINPA